MADALPALGIVAAVLGVIKTMGSITEPPEVLGAMIGGALVGTFLGVFLAYGLVGPMAARMKDVVDEEAAFYQIIQSVLVAHLHGNAAQISVEIGRGSVPSRRPAELPGAGRGAERGAERGGVKLPGLRAGKAAFLGWRASASPNRPTLAGSAP